MSNKLSEEEKYDIISNIVFNKILYKYGSNLNEKIESAIDRKLFPASEKRIQEISDSIGLLQKRLSEAWESVEIFESISLLITIRDSLNECIENINNDKYEE